MRILILALTLAALSPMVRAATLGGEGGAISGGALTPATINASGAVKFSVAFSTQAAGSAGTAVTATCPAGTFALSGGCSCSGIVAGTAVIGVLDPLNAGSMPTGYKCQIAGGTGGACAAAVLCSKIQI